MKKLVFVLVLLGAAHAKAGCDFEYRPGQFLYVDAGHEVRVLVHGEDMDSYSNRSIPNKGEGLPEPTDENIEKLRASGLDVQTCGDYREVSDADVY